MSAVRAAVAEAAPLPGLGEEGPDDLRFLLGVFFGLLGAGFVIGIAGHVLRSRALVAVGVTLIFVGTGFFVAAVGARG